MKWLSLVAAVFVVGCHHDDPPKLDLSKDNRDAAEKIANGEQVPPSDVMPKAGN